MYLYLIEKNIGQRKWQTDWGQEKNFLCFINNELFSGMVKEVCNWNNYLEEID